MCISTYPITKIVVKNRTSEVRYLLNQPIPPVTMFCVSLTAQANLPAQVTIGLVICNVEDYAVKTSNGLLGARKTVLSDKHTLRIKNTNGLFKPCTL